jgi:hypothetical protein
MKKSILLSLLVLVTAISFAQDWRYTAVRNQYPGKENKFYREAEFAKLDTQYMVTVGTSKLNASFDKDGIELKDKDLRLVGLLFRNNKLEVSELMVIIKKDGAIIDSSTISCGPNNKWKDFYINLADVIPSERYSIDVYYAVDKKLLDSKEFYIRKEK